MEQGDEMNMSVLVEYKLFTTLPLNNNKHRLWTKIFIFILMSYLAQVFVTVLFWIPKKSFFKATQFNTAFSDYEV